MDPEWFKTKARPSIENTFIRLDSGAIVNRFNEDYYAEIAKREREITAEKHEQLGRMFELDGVMQKAFFHYKRAAHKSNGQAKKEIEHLIRRLEKRGFVDRSPDPNDADARLERWIRIGKWTVAALAAINVALLLFLWPGN